MKYFTYLIVACIIATLPQQIKAQKIEEFTIEVVNEHDVNVFVSDVTITIKDSRNRNKNNATKTTNSRGRAKVVLESGIRKNDELKITFKVDGYRTSTSTVEYSDIKNGVYRKKLLPEVKRIDGYIVETGTRGYAIGGVSIKIKGSNIGTASETNGSFDLPLPDKSISKPFTLIFKHPDYYKEEKRYDNYRAYTERRVKQFVLKERIKSVQIRTDIDVDKIYFKKYPNYKTTNFRKDKPKSLQVPSEIERGQTIILVVEKEGFVHTLFPHDDIQKLYSDLNKYNGLLKVKDKLKKIPVSNPNPPPKKKPEASKKTKTVVDTVTIEREATLLANLSDDVLGELEMRKRKVVSERDSLKEKIRAKDDKLAQIKRDYGDQSVQYKKVLNEKRELVKEVGNKDRVIKKLDKNINNLTRQQEKLKEQAKQIKASSKKLAESNKQLSRINIALAIIASLLFISLIFLFLQLRSYKKQKLKNEQANTKLKDTKESLESTITHLEATKDKLNSNLKEIAKKNTEIAKRKEDLETTTQQLKSSEEELKIQAEELIAQKEYAEGLYDQLTERHKATLELQKMKDILISAINHDLRNPLNPIMNYSKPGFQAPEDHRLARIHSKSRRMFSMIEDIVDVYRGDKIELTKVSQSIHQITNQAIQELSDIDTNLPTIQNKISQDLKAICDAKYIQRVLENLLSNAIKYTSYDGTITFSAKETENYAIISITDTGAGIPTDKLEEIFIPFMNPNAKSLGKAKSVGLGLAFCKTIIEMHDSKIDVKSEVDKGTSFSFVLEKPIQKNEERVIDYNTVPTLSEEETVYIKPILEKLTTLKLYDSKTLEIINSIEVQKDSNLEVWKNILLKCKDENDKIRYKELLNYY